MAQNPQGQGPGVINDFTLDQLEPTPITNYSRLDAKFPRLIKPWLLSAKYPNQAVFVHGNPWEWFRGGGYEKDGEFDKELVLPHLDDLNNTGFQKIYNKFVHEFGMPKWYDSYKTAIDFDHPEWTLKSEEGTKLTDETINDIVQKLGTVRRWLHKDNLFPFYKDMAYMPLKKDPDHQGSNLFIGHTYYNYNHNGSQLGSFTDAEWDEVIRDFKKYLEKYTRSS